MLEIRTEGATVFLKGRLDASQVPSANAVLGEMTGHAVLDLSELEYLSSAGIGVLIATLKHLQDNGGSLRIRNAPPRILNLFQLAGLDRVLEIE